jgi:transcriptional regulator GlxA family with amidase domain
LAKNHLSHQQGIIMKIVTVFLAMFSLTAFANNTQPAHLASCAANESCLIHLNYSEVIKNVTIKDDRGGVVIETPNVNGNLSDTVYVGAQLCYQGKTQEVCRVLAKLAEREKSPAHGSVVSKFSCKANGNKINLLYTVEYDISSTPENLKFAIPKCN